MTWQTISQISTILTYEVGGRESITLHRQCKNWLNIILRNATPDKQSCHDQHHRQVHCQRSLKVELFEEGCGVSDEKEQHCRQVGGQKLVH